MFKLSFTKADLVRALWTFAAAFGAALAVSAGSIHDLSTAEAAGLAAVAAGISALKNLILADGTLLKGDTPK